jgi:hypothetical protein
LTIDNSACKVALTVNDVVVISASQQQFTDKTHHISLISGIGENWWSEGSGQQEVAIANVVLEISDADPQPSYSPTLTPSHPLPTKTATPDPPATPTPTACPSASPSATPDIPEFPAFTIILLATATLLVSALGLKRKNHAKNKM